MKRWQILVTVVVMVAVGLAGYAVGASRQTTDIAVESQLASEGLADDVQPSQSESTSELAAEESISELAAEETASADAEVGLDYTEGGVPENNFYQPIKVHIDWDPGDLDPWD